MNYDLSGKKALVTGAAGGIGTAIAQELCQAGATVILTGRRKEALEKVAENLGGETHIITGDLQSKEAIFTLFEQTEAISGGIDILVCNAGITRDNLVLRMKEEEWQEVLDTNLSATFFLNKTALRGMIKRRWGRIVNITSVVGVSGNPGQANYAASKAGIIGMSKAIAAECAARGVTVNCIAPGFVKTAMTDALNEQQQEKITTTIPMGSFGLPEDIAYATAFLASARARYITGQTLHVNGGMLMV